MKKVALILFLVVAVGAFLAAQQNAPSEVASTHYQVFSSLGSGDAQSISNEMEAYFTLFNSYFHFNPSTLKAKLKVRIYANKSEFDKYLSQIIPGTRNSFVYLQYSDPARSVLVGYHMSNESTFQTDLVHHGFVQFLKSFVPHPPLWLQEGFAVYFEASRYDSSTGQASFHPNLGWLPTLKQGLQAYLASNSANVIAPTELLTIDAAGANKNIDAFYAESWGLVSFLINSSNKDFNRVLWDAVDALSPEATTAQNESAVQKNAFDWVKSTAIENGLKSYIETVKTFPELVQAGMTAYSSGQLKPAETDFKDAVKLDPKSYVPYYYLGLISYSGKDYYLAEQYFQTSLQMGGNAGLVNYALGINAFADNRIADAKKYLSQAVSVQSTYKDKAASLLDRINQQSSAQ